MNKTLLLIIKTYLIGFILLPVSTNVFAQRLELFTSESEAIINNGNKERVPYSRAIGFYNYIPDGTLPDEIINNIGFYDVYFELPTSVQEIGVRLISPIPEYVFAHTGDIETEEYSQWYNADKSVGFDPFIILEYGIVDEKGKFSTVAKLGENDNSKEVIPQPTGKFNNSLLRVIRDDLPAGIYRIRIASADTKENGRGSYLLHLGLVPGLRGIKISENLERLRDGE